MSHKFTPVDGYTTYEGKGHYSCLTTRLHNADEVNEGHTTMGLTHFLPGGRFPYGSCSLRADLLLCVR